MRSMIFPATAATFLCAASAAHAGVVNGDFESGGTGWSVSVPMGWSVTFVPNGGNPGGHARIESPAGGGGGTACIRQTFECGAPDASSVCSIPLDFRADLGQIEGQATMRIFVNGTQFSPTGLGPDDFTWQHIELGGYCGTDVLELCLSVVAGSPRWALLLDNVMSISFCETVGTESSPWTTVKSLYREPSP